MSTICRSKRRLPRHTLAVPAVWTAIKLVRLGPSEVVGGGINEGTPKKKYQVLVMVFGFRWIHVDFSEFQ